MPVFGAPAKQDLRAGPAAVVQNHTGCAWLVAERQAKGFVLRGCA